MRANIVIDDGLMAKAMCVTGFRTKREAVELGLKTLIQFREQGDIRELRSQPAWTGDLDAMRIDA